MTNREIVEGKRTLHRDPTFQEFGIVPAVAPGAGGIPLRRKDRTENGSVQNPVRHERTDSSVPLVISMTEKGLIWSTQRSRGPWAVEYQYANPDPSSQFLIRVPVGQDSLDAGIRDTVGFLRVKIPASRIFMDGAEPGAVYRIRVVSLGSNTSSGWMPHIPASGNGTVKADTVRLVLGSRIRRDDLIGKSKEQSGVQQWHLLYTAPADITLCVLPPSGKYVQVRSRSLSPAAEGENRLKIGGMIWNLFQNWKQNGNVETGVYTVRVYLNRNRFTTLQFVVIE